MKKIFNVKTVFIMSMIVLLLHVIKYVMTGSVDTTSLSVWSILTIAWGGIWFGNEVEKDEKS
jgi:hypothetical protein